MKKHGLLFKTLGYDLFIKKHMLKLDKNVLITDHKHKLQSPISVVWSNLGKKRIKDGTQKQQDRGVN